MPIKQAQKTKKIAYLAVFMLVAVLAFPVGTHAVEYTIQEAPQSQGGSGGGGGGGGSSRSDTSSSQSNMTAQEKANCNQDSDNKVDIFDLSILLSHWSQATQTCDQNDDGLIDIFDFSLLLSNWTSS